MISCSRQEHILLKRAVLTESNSSFIASTGHWQIRFAERKWYAMLFMFRRRCISMHDFDSGRTRYQLPQDTAIMSFIM